MTPRCSLALLAATLFGSLPWLPLPAAEYEGIRIIAHRGAGFEVDENTVEACRHSYELGIRGFEVDLRMTKDDHLVLMHDDTVTRTTGGTGAVERMSADEVRALRTLKDKAPVPFATDLFAYFKDKPDIFIELEMKMSKTDAYSDERLEIYCKQLHDGAQAALAPGSYLFTSFDRRVLTTLKRLYPDAPIMLITSAPPPMELIQEAKNLGCARIAIGMDVTSRKFVREAQKAGLKVAGWPTRSEADAKLAVALGVDSFTTDIPSQFVTPKPTATK